MPVPEEIREEVEMMPWPNHVIRVDNEDDPDTLAQALEMHNRLRDDYQKALAELERLRGRLVSVRYVHDAWRHVAWSFIILSCVLFVMLLWEASI